jgi:hypothetical protein
MGLGSEIWDPEKTYSGSQIQDPGSWIRIRNTGSWGWWALRSQINWVWPAFSVLHVSESPYKIKEIHIKPVHNFVFYSNLATPLRDIAIRHPKIAVLHLYEEYACFKGGKCTYKI